MQDLNEYVWASILGIIVLALIFPAPGILLKPYVGYLLILLMTLACLHITPKDIKTALTHKEVYLVVALVVLATPLLALLAKPFLHPEIFTGLLIATAVPAGISVAFISELFGGKPAEALSISTLSHLISIISMPTILFLCAKVTATTQIEPIVVALAKFVLIPLMLAQLLRKTLSKYTKHTSGISTVILLMIIWGIIAPTRDKLLTQFDQMVSVFIICAAIMTLAFFAGWLLGKNKKLKITYAISASYKNYALATVIALSTFGELAAFASISYTVLNNVMFAIAKFFIKT